MSAPLLRPSVRYARYAGALLQAAILGFLLFAAVSRLIAIESGARVFQYQAW